MKEAVKTSSNPPAGHEYYERICPNCERIRAFNAALKVIQNIALGIFYIAVLFLSICFIQGVFDFILSQDGKRGLTRGIISI